MKRAHRSSMLGLVVTGALLAACGGATSPNDPSDAEVAPDTSVPEAAALDSAPSNPPIPDADTKDPEADTREPGDATVDAADAGDATVDATDASVPPDATSDAGTSPPALFMPGESGALYEMRAVCSIQTVDSVGTVNNCCAVQSATVTTTCETMVREESDGAGSLRVVVDPLQGCMVVSNLSGCTKTAANPNYCGSLPGMGCAVLAPYLGSPDSLKGVYARRWVRVGAATVPASHYWIPGCPRSPVGASPSCTRGPGGGSNQGGDILTTLERTGNGELTVRRTWDSSPSGIGPQSCRGPDAQAPLALRSSTFSRDAVSGGGTFSTQKYSCTYTLTKK